MAIEYIIDAVAFLKQEYGDICPVFCRKISQTFFQSIFVSAFLREPRDAVPEGPLIRQRDIRTKLSEPLPVWQTRCQQLQMRHHGFFVPVHVIKCVEFRHL